MSAARTDAGVVRLQKLQTCEIALAEGVEKNDGQVLQWFTADILHLQRSWATVVVAALLDRNKAGDYRWRSAKNPLGLIRTIARRIALKSYPELIFGDDADKVLNPNGRAISTLSVAPDGQTGTYADSEGEVLGTGYWHDEFIDKATFDGGDFDDGPEVWNELDSSLVARKKDALAFNWHKIGARLQLTRDQTKLLKARASGVTRAAMGEHLSWDNQKVERVWKAVNRLFERPEMPQKVRAALCAHQ